MALNDISDPAAIRKAVAEYDKLGEAAFLQKYGFDPSRKFWLSVPEGKLRRYTSKAVLGAAHGFQFPRLGPLQASDFSGGGPTTAKLRALGFTVVDGEADPQNPDWVRDEIILAMDLYLQRRDRLPGKGSPEVAALSALLIRLHSVLGTKGKPTLRNTNGVYMKLMNFRRLDPTVTGSGRTGLTGGSDLEVEIWQEFSSDLPRLHRVAEAIARVIQETATEDAGGDSTGVLEEISDDEEGAEGRLLTRAHRSRERNRKLVARKKTQAFARYGCFVCEVCSFNFEDRYGLHGAGFIECHHTKPLETLDTGSTTKLADMALLCANCHRMIHARRPWLSLGQLRALLRTSR